MSLLSLMATGRMQLTPGYSAQTNGSVAVFREGFSALPPPSCFPGAKWTACGFGFTGTRMVFDTKDQYPSQWLAMELIASKIGRTGETLCKWVRQGESDSGVRPALRRLSRST